MVGSSGSCTYSDSPGLYTEIEYKRGFEVDLWLDAWSSVHSSCYGSIGPCVASAPQTGNGKILTLGRAKTSLIIGFFRAGCRREQLQPPTGQAESRLP